MSCLYTTEEDCLQTNTGIIKGVKQSNMELLTRGEYIIVTSCLQKGVKNNQGVHGINPSVKAVDTKCYTYVTDEWQLCMHN